MAINSRAHTLKQISVARGKQRSFGDGDAPPTPSPVDAAKVQTGVEARQVLAQATTQATAARQLMNKLAHNAGMLIAKANLARDPSQKQQLLSKAYDSRTTAELAKHSAVYAQLAKDRITNAISVGQSDPDRGKSYVKDAQALLDASDAALASDKSIPQPAVLQFLKAPPQDQMQELTMLGTEKTATGGAFSKKNASALFPNMPLYWPDDVQTAAAGALGDVTAPLATDPNFQANVQQAFGTGVAASNSAATTAAKDATKANPTAGGIIAMAGAALTAFGVQLAQSQAAGYQTGVAPPPPAEIPWVTIGVGAAGLGVLYLLLRR